ncbi:MAG: hypothetical protein HZB38_15965 [Planctomycetes bacterium]|nr:hypothetical protein [Planctomycetota bacterium]
MKHPVRWYVAGLLVLIAAAASLLAQPGVTKRDERDVQYFLARHVSECVFDATSAVCGSGLLAGGLDERYAESGRWVLLAAGIAGALLHIGMTATILRRIWAVANAPAPAPIAASLDPNAEFSVPQNPPPTPLSPVPPLRIVLLVPVVLAALLTLGVFAAGRATCPTVTIGETGWLVGCAAFSLGFVQSPNSGTALMLAVAAFLAGLGWPVWLSLVPRLRARGRRFGAGALVFFTLALACFAGLLCIVEQPRGGESVGKLNAAGEQPDMTLARQPLAERYGRSLVATTAAGVAGIATEPLSDRGVRDGSKGLLALVQLVGGPLGGASGGVTATLLWLGVRRRGSIWRVALVRTIAVLGVLTLLTALGLLAIEATVATRYQPPPTFADALLDASSVVGGGGLTSDLISTVTARNLVSGIGLGINQYQLGMLGIVIAMIIGRVAPAWALERAVSQSRGA